MNLNTCTRNIVLFFVNSMQRVKTLRVKEVLIETNYCRYLCHSRFDPCEFAYSRFIFQRLSPSLSFFALHMPILHFLIFCLENDADTHPGERTVSTWALCSVEYPPLPSWSTRFPEDQADRNWYRGGHCSECPAKVRFDPSFPKDIYRTFICHLCYF